MIKFLTIFIWSVFFGISSVTAQRVLILENNIIGKSYKIYPGEHISMKVSGSTKKISGRITQIIDSSVIISNYMNIELKDVTVVYRKRLAFQILSNTAWGFGAMYAILDLANNTINNDKPLLQENVAIISGALVVTGAILSIFNTRKCVIAKTQWKLKTAENIHFIQK